MSEVTRREFMAGLVAAASTSELVPPSPAAARKEIFPENSSISKSSALASDVIDFKYAPRLWQTAICFPDDSRKSLVGQAGDLRYGFSKDLLVGMEDFSTICSFSLAGMQDDRIVRQWLESPSTPIVHTLVDRPTAQFELIAFASNRSGEGRVDNVLMSIKSKQERVSVVPRIHIRTCARIDLQVENHLLSATNKSTGSVFLLAGKVPADNGSANWWEEAGYTIYLPHGEAESNSPLTYLIRFPQDGQSARELQQGFVAPQALLDETRTWWKEWKPFGSVQWNYPGRQGEFLNACARNIQQAREVKEGRSVFQVGPTVYRGLWIVDGNFLLEAARYLGYDKEADQGLRSEWSKQLPSGQVIAAVPGEHWKDTAIAMFTLVRQCELKQDWSDFKDLEPNVRKAIDFLIAIRDKARNTKSANGRYGILAPGFADGGIDGVRSEFTNTVWTLAALKAVAGAAERLGATSLAHAAIFYKELRAAFAEAAAKEMRKHPDGFQYLPMLAHEDSAAYDPDPWKHPRPQSAQWALSHAIFPGNVFDPPDPVVRGHIALLQSCTREDIPAETGWLWHESVWNYNASFAAHVYLWAGLHDWARRAFSGFLNHASPLYCWREEQPLQNALVGQDWGDMPHNWASAECVRYLRHMLVLEDGLKLRLLEGFANQKTELPGSYSLANSPTRFGRINLDAIPEDKRTVKVSFSSNNPGIAIESVAVPALVANRRFKSLEGASFRADHDRILVDPGSKRWTAIFQ